MRLWCALGLAVLIAACSSGGGGSSAAVPTLPWGSFRHDTSNSGVGGSINQNKGNVELVTDQLGGVTLSTPAVDGNGTIYIGTSDGLLAIDPDGDLRWRFNSCVLSDGSPPIPVGPVSSSPFVTPGDMIVFGSDDATGKPGAVFALKHKQTTPECVWMFRPSDASDTFRVRSSAAVGIDPFDLFVLSTFIGGSDGRLFALNSDGTERYRFPSLPAPGDVSSTPAVDATNTLYATTPDGVLSAIDFSGRLRWQYPIGTPPAAALLSSPAVGVTAYAIGAEGVLFGFNSNGTLKFQYLPAGGPLVGSPAFLSQTLDIGAETMLDTVVYGVDGSGTLYGVSDLSGDTLQLQRCMLPTPVPTPGQTPGPTPSPNNPFRSCRMDSCLPDQGECNGNTKRCSVTNFDCTVDSCKADNNGTCEAMPAIFPANPPVPVSTSPAVSADLFVVIGTEDGQVCVRALDGNVPGEEDDPINRWLNGCVTLGEGQATRSSPVIGKDGRIYVTTDEGLFVIE